MKEFLKQNYHWLIILLVLIGLRFLSESFQLSLQYQRDAVLAGEVYRLLTGHFVHTNIAHTLFNLLGLVLLGLLSRQALSMKDWWVTICLSSLLISIGFLFVMPELQWYRGLSGILHALALMVILKSKQLASVIRSLLVAMLIVKLVMEQLQLNLWQSEVLIGSPVIVNAHLYGFIGGMISYIGLQATRSKRMFRENF